MESNGVLLFHSSLDERTKEDILNLAANCYAHVANQGAAYWWAKIP